MPAAIISAQRVAERLLVCLTKPLKLNVRRQMNYKPILVPWSVSPSGSALSLIHSESDGAPTCQVDLLAYNPNQVSPISIRIEFDSPVSVRIGSRHDDLDIESEGFEMDIDINIREIGRLQFREQWVKNGICPDPGIYLSSVAIPGESSAGGVQKYLIVGRSEYIEVVALSAKWCENSLSGEYNEKWEEFAA